MESVFKITPESNIQELAERTAELYKRLVLAEAKLADSTARIEDLKYCVQRQCNRMDYLRASVIAGERNAD